MLRKIAAVLAAVTAAIHILVGGIGAVRPMLEAGLSVPVEGALHAAWHIISAFFLWSVFVFWRGGDTALHFGFLWLVSGAIFIYIGLTQYGLNGLIALPQWTILIVTGVVAMVAERPWFSSRS
ncbi:MAG: hypothetical protein ACPGWR_19580 [Ardenticatenaceae bacterium]